MGRTRTPSPLHAEPGEMIAGFPNDKRTANQEGGPRVLRGKRSDRSPPAEGCWQRRRYGNFFFLLNGVVGDGPRTHFTQSRAPGGMTTDFLRKKDNLK